MLATGQSVCWVTGSSFRLNWSLWLWEQTWEPLIYGAVGAFFRHFHLFTLCLHSPDNKVKAELCSFLHIC